MLLKPIDQIRAIQSALTTGAADYRTQAAHQRDKENMTGVDFATTRANFLIGLYGHLETVARQAEQAGDDPLFAWTLPSDELQNIADSAAASVHATIHYDATKHGEAQKQIPPSKLGGE